MATLGDAAARTRAQTDLAHTLAVDAGAGTGKTTVLVERMMELVAGGCPLRAIAAITFTEKAAGELKQRLRSKLEERAAANDPEGRFRDALDDLDRAQVATIHAFCAALLHERPAEAGVDPNFGVLDELAAFVLRHHVWRRWIAGELSGGGRPAARALIAEPSLFNQQKAAEYLLENRDLRLCFPPRVVADTDAFLVQLTRSVRTLRQLQAACVDERDRGFRQINDLAAAVTSVTDLDADGREELVLAIEVTPTAGSQTHWRPRERLAEAKEILRSLRETRDAVIAAVQHNRCCDVVEWLGGYLDAYEAAKQQRSGLDFTDLLIKTRDVLRDDLDVRGQFQRRFRALLVDEFQDTDPLQTEIVFFLAERNASARRWIDVELTPGKLFLVGDPKQSIYRFRRADIELYAEAKQVALQQPTRGAAVDLRTNFRSGRPLIAWINERFSELIQSPGDGVYQPAYVPLEPNPALPDDHEPRVHLLSIPQPDPQRSAQGDRLAAEGRIVAEHLRHLVAARTPIRAADGGTRDLTHRDIAILFRDNDPMHVYEDALRERGIPYRLTGGKRFYGREEVTALLALIRCVANPKDQVNLIATLRGAFFGFSDEQLFLFKSSGGRFDYTQAITTTADHAAEFGAAFDVLNRLQTRSREVGPAALLNEIFAAVPHVLPLFYLKPQGDQRVANLVKLVDIARTLEADEVHSLRGLARFLADLEALEAEEAESPVAEDTDDVVRLMTIHKAKGLEFPVVVLADGTRALSFRPPVGIVNRLTGELGLHIGAARTANWDRLKQWERPRSEAEESRLLYVATTRARDLLVVPQYPAVERGGFLGSLVAASEHARVIDPTAYEIAARPPSAFRIEGVADAASDPAVIEKQRNWETQRAELIATASRAPVIRSATSIAHGEPPSQGAFEFGRRHGAQIGNLVHAVLQRVEIHDVARIDALASGVAGGMGLDAMVVGVAANLARTALALPVLERARRTGNVLRELPFTWATNGQLVEGVIDLLFRERDEIVIVDYKTDDIGRGRELDERVALYLPQAVMYAAAIEAITQQPVKEVVLAFLRPSVEKKVRADWQAEAAVLLRS